MIESELEYLSTLLESVDCGEYLSTFQALDISPDLLVSLDPEAIRELGITKVGDRLRLQVLVKLLMLERIKNEINISSLNESIEGAAESIIKIDEHIKGVESVKNRIITLNVISQDGETHTVEINKEKAAAGLTEARKRILLSVTGILDPSEWKLFYIDYSIGERGVPHEVTDTELNEIIKSAGSQDDKSGLEEHSHRLIVCDNGEMPSIDAINVSNKIHRNKRSKNDVEIKPFMGGRPPSQMISTNLHEFFPGLESKEIADIKRKSKRLSIYSTKMMNDLNTKKRLTFSSSRDSIYSRLSNISKLSDGMSLLSVASYGVAKPLRIDKAVDFEEFNNSPKSYIDAATGNEKEFTAITPCKGSDSSNKSISEGANIVGDDNNSIIELLDESDDEFEGNEEMEMMTVIDNEVTNGPSVWHKGPKIGQGSFGNVYLGLNGLTGELMAIKQVDIPQNESEKSKKMMVTALKQEISLLKDLKHDNIVRYLGSNTDASNMYIFLEYIPGGSVSSMLQMYGAFEEELIRNFTRQVLIGLVYLHSQGIVHRDIKGGNILVDNTGTVKIGDFGISKKIEHEEEETTTSTTKKRSSLQGSVYWMAPEVVKQVAYTAKADIWSVGCLVVEMFTGNHPYPGLSPMQAIFQIGTGRIQPAVPAKAQSSPEAVLFLGRALDPDHISRWTAEDLLQRDAFVQLE